MKRKMIVAILMFAIMGCQPARQTIVDISLEDANNTKMMLEVAEILKEGWPVKSGFLDGLNIREEELPYEVVKAKKELDRLAEKEELTHYELGYFLGLKVLLMGSIVQATVEKYAPNIIQYLPPIF